MIQAAIVGLGWWGRKMVDVVQGKSTFLRFTRAVEPQMDAAADFARQHGLQLGDRLQDALEDPAIQAVVLATPHALHTEQVAVAARAGKHVFCEKPLALTHAQAVQSVQACAQRGLVLGMGHERRFEPPVAELLRRAACGELGRIVQVEANFSHNRSLKLAIDNWRLDGSHSPAGGMTATGIHLIDLANVLLGDAADALCTSEQLASQLPQGDTVSAYVRYRSGGTLYLGASLSIPFVSRFAAYGTRGWYEIRDKALVDTPQGWMVIESAEGGPIRVHEHGPTEPVRDNLDAFAQAVAGQAAYPITGQDLVRNTAVLEAIFRSARSHEIENVPA